MALPAHPFLHSIHVPILQHPCTNFTASMYQKSLPTKASWPLNLLGATPMKKLPVAPQLGMGFMCYPSISTGMLTVFIVCSSCAGHHSCSEFRSVVLCHVQKTLFSHSGSYNPSTSLAGMLLSLDRRMYGPDVPFMSEHSIHTYIVSASELSAFLGDLTTFCALMGDICFQYWLGNIRHKR